MPLPHAGPAQQLAKTGCLAAQCEFQAGDAEGAVRDLLAVLVLGRRMGSDLTLNSVLIQFAIDYMVARTGAENLHSIPPALLENLGPGLRGLPPRTTLAEAVRYDQEYMLGWYEKRVEAIRRESLNEPETAMSLIAESLAALEAGDWRPRLRQAAANNPGDVLQLLHQTELYYDQAAGLLKLPYADFESSAREFRNRIEKEPNPFPEAFLKAFIAPRTRGKEFRAETSLAMLETGIEWRRQGAVVLDAMPNPVSGHPFSLMNTTTGFALKSDVKFENEFVILPFGDLKQPAKP
jgi:hypothetical protein